MEEKINNYILMEIRAGAGGEEAALFVSDLFRMYQKYSQKNNWQLKVIDEKRTDLGGLREVVFEIEGQDAYKKLKCESGVHRVQRIPKTEKSGRLHTSTATVATLPLFQERPKQINPNELKIEFFRSSGPGGQNVNKVETAVRIIHLPSQIVVSCQSERSQQKNIEKALKILSAKLAEKEREEFEAKVSQTRKEQIKRAMRAEKIRTYNFPQNRVTDHRYHKSWYNLEDVLEGGLERITKLCS